MSPGWWDTPTDKRKRTSTAEADDERLLLPGLHGVRAVVPPHPRHGVAGRKSTKDCCAGQGRSGSSMAAEAAHLNPFSTASAFQQRPKGGDHGSGITGHTEIGSFEVIVGPRRIPLRVEVETEIGSLLAGIGISGIKGHGDDLGPVRQYDHGSMQVHVKLLVIVVRVSALCGFIVHVPVDLALRTHD
jgi:hypothetical protein